MNDGLQTGHTVWFDDVALLPVSQCCQAANGSVYNGYMDGRYRPVDALARCPPLPPPCSLP